MLLLPLFINFYTLTLNELCLGWALVYSMIRIGPNWTHRQRAELLLVVALDLGSPSPSNSKQSKRLNP